MHVLPNVLHMPCCGYLCLLGSLQPHQQLPDAAQVLEALALAEPPPEVQDSLKPDHEWMLSTANDELESFRVGSTTMCVTDTLTSSPRRSVLTTACLKERGSLWVCLLIAGSG